MAWRAVASWFLASTGPKTGTEKGHRVKNLKVQTWAVDECQAGNCLPLLQMLAGQLQDGHFAELICDRLYRGKPFKQTKRDLIGCQVERMLHKRPREKKQICAEVAAEFGLSARTGSTLRTRTVENYHAHWQKIISKPVRQELNRLLDIGE